MNGPFDAPARGTRRLAALRRRLGRALGLRPRGGPRRRRGGVQAVHPGGIDSLECEANAMTPGRWSAP